MDDWQFIKYEFHEICLLNMSIEEIVHCQFSIINWGPGLVLVSVKRRHGVKRPERRCLSRRRVCGAHSETQWRSSSADAALNFWFFSFKRKEQAIFNFQLSNSGSSWYSIYWLSIKTPFCACWRAKVSGSLKKRSMSSWGKYCPFCSHQNLKSSINPSGSFGTGSFWIWMFESFRSSSSNFLRAF